MNRDFLNGLELDKEIVDTIMAEYGKGVQGLKEQLEDYKSQLSTTKETLSKLESEDIESIKTELQNYKDKEVQRIADEKKAKEESIKNERTNAFFDGVKFSSESAKEGMMARFNKMDFRYDEESKKFVGGNEWLEDMKKNDSGSFVSDVANPKYTTGATAPTENGSLDSIMRAMGISNEKEK